VFIFSGFRVQGSGFRVQGSGFRVQGSGTRVQGSGFLVLLNSGYYLLFICLDNMQTIKPFF